jgi:hypothetical protein
LDLPENSYNIYDIESQLLHYNYKLINRIINQENYKDDNVPFELASVLPAKNIEAFRSFYSAFTKGKKNIPIEDFKLNHTQHGSFIIPISIPAEVGGDRLINIANETNLILRKYLDTIDKLLAVPIQDVKNYADRVIDEGIDSRLVKDFFSKNDSVAKYKTKYQNIVKDIYFTVKSNPILDYKLSDTDRNFKVVDLGGISVLPDEYIDFLEKREIEADSSTRSDDNAKIDVEVDSIDINGTAKFKVFAINNEPLSKPFKATTSELPKVKQDFCADAFKSRNTIVITGDILKTKGKSGKIIVDTFEIKPEDNKLL